MTSDDAATGIPDGAAPDADDLHGAVVVGAVPGQPPRVVKEAARYARLMSAPLVVVHVDVTRFVTYEDPDGFVPSSPREVHPDAGAAELEEVRALAAEHLAGKGVAWTVRQLVGDPALAIKRFADEVDARLLVVGTRRRGIGESLRELLTGSVAARLSHRQHRAILVVPLGEALADDEEWSIDG